MKHLFTAIMEHIRLGQSVVLCTILASSGSSPRGAGAKMAVFADGTTLGTVGGGAVELEAVKQAMEVLKTGDTLVRGYQLHPNEVADIGMICGGEVTVFFQRFSEADHERLTAILSVLDGEENAWLVTRIREGCAGSLGVFSAAEGLRYTDGVTEQELSPLLRSRAVYTEDLYVEPLVQAGTVYIFGGGHVG